MRKRAQLTQVELEERTKVPQSTISGLENDTIARPRDRTIEALAEGLGVLPEEITGEVPPPVIEGEKELLAAYRELPPSGRLALLASARGLRSIRFSLERAERRDHQPE